MQQKKLPSVREIRTPQGHAKICELYENGSDSQVIIKIRGNIYTFPSQYLIDKLTCEESNQQEN